MVTTILGTKKEMGMRFDQRGSSAAVTVIAAEPNTVLVTSDNRVQLATGSKKKAARPESIYTKTIGFAPKFIHQVKIRKEGKMALQTGDKITVAVFEPQDLVKVTGTTIGKGFAGGVKRWGFAGGPKTHGQSDRHRAPGSIGQATTPGRVYKGKHMAGHMGVARKTITNLEVVEVDLNKNQLVVKGAVPGAKNGFLIIEKTGKAKSYTPPPPPSEVKEEEKEEQSQKTTSAKEQEEKEPEPKSPSTSQKPSEGGKTP